MKIMIKTEFGGIQSWLRLVEGRMRHIIRTCLEIWLEWMKLDIKNPMKKKGRMR